MGCIILDVTKDGLEIFEKLEEKEIKSICKMPLKNEVRLGGFLQDELKQNDKLKAIWDNHKTAYIKTTKECSLLKDKDCERVTINNFSALSRDNILFGVVTMINIFICNPDKELYIRRPSTV